MRYLKANNGSHLIEDPQYSDAKDLWDDTLHEASLLDAEVRDCLAIMAGQSSLKESRTSIQIAQEQIKESKRSKSPCSPTLLCALTTL